MNKRILLLCAALVPSVLFAQTFSDDFESYTAGQYIGTSSPNWTTWSGTTGGTEDTQVTTANAHSGSNAVYFSSTSASGGPQDCVLPFGGNRTKGVLNYKMWMYVNSNKGAYFNMQGTTTPGDYWTIDVTFNTNSTFTINSGGSTMVSGNYTQASWFEIEMDYNLNNNICEFLIDGNSLGKFQCFENLIGSIDIFPLQNHQFYVDDVEYTYTAPTSYSFNATAFGINNMNGLPNKRVEPGLTIKNSGTTTITSFDMELDYNGNQYPISVTGVSVTAGKTYTTKVPTPITLAGTILPATLTISNINGTTDNNTTDDIKILDVVPNTSVTPAAGKRVVMEEATGTWCGWCPRGAVFMDVIGEKYYDNIAPIAVHWNDAMEIVPYGDDMYNMVGGSFPTVKADRNANADPLDAEAQFLTYITTVPKTSIINGANWNSSTRQLDVSISTTFNTASTGNYKLVCVLTENEVTGFSQNNYYAGGSAGPMHGFESLPSTAPASVMVYNYVARAIAPSTTGLSNAFGTSQTSGQQFVHNFSFNVPASWDETKMHIVGFVVLPNGKIDNADYTTINDAVSNGYVSGTVITGIETPDGPDADITIYPNPANDQAIISMNFDTESEISIDIYSIDGKLIATKNYGKLNGANNFPVNMSTWNNGIYYVKIYSKAGVITKNLIKQ